MNPCYNGCPDCKCVEPATTNGNNVEVACRCYPANTECPSEVVCGPRKLGLVELASGMVRSDPTGKPDYTLVCDRLLERWAVHMTKNVESKGHNNWRKAHSEEDLARFLASAWRHFIAFTRGETDEDHAAALLFNVAGAESVRRQNN